LPIAFRLRFYLLMRHHTDRPLCHSPHAIDYRCYQLRYMSRHFEAERHVPAAIGLCRSRNIALIMPPDMAERFVYIILKLYMSTSARKACTTISASACFSFSAPHFYFMPFSATSRISRLCSRVLVGSLKVLSRLHSLLPIMLYFSFV